MNAEHRNGVGSGSQPEQIGSLDLGVALQILRNRRRRLVLDYLAMEDPADYDDVVDYVVREEIGLGYSETERKRVYVALYQSHGPRLDESGVVLFDGTSGPLCRGPEFAPVYNALLRLRDATEEDAEEDAEGVAPPWKRLRDLLGA